VTVTLKRLVAGWQKSSKDTESNSIYNALLYMALKGAG